MVTVAVLDDYLGVARRLADWDAIGPGTEVSFFTEPMAPADLVAALAPFEVLVLMRERTAFPAELLAQLPALRLVVTTGMANAALDVDHLNRRGVVVCGTGGSAAGPPAGPPAGPLAGPPVGLPTPVEVAWALILAVTKRVVAEDRAMRDGRWQVGLPADLAGSTLGLAGLGRLGAAMVAPARVFGMDVVAWSQNLTDQRAADLGVRRVSKADLLATADVLSIHLVLGPRTRGLFQAADLAQMKPTAFLVNTSRGPIVDETALVAALRDGAIAGAGLDVFDREPLPADHPLRRLDNAVVLPHLGYVTESVLRGMYGQAVEDIRAFLQGAPIRVLADPNSGGTSR